MIFFNKENKEILSISVDDNSYRQRELMGEHRLTLYFSLSTHIEIPIDTYVDYQGERYSLISSESLKIKHSRLFEYTITMESEQAKAKLWRFRCMYKAENEQNLTDGRLKFSLTATPREHLQMFIDNMNLRDDGWEIGKCIQDVEKCISYNHASCLSALQQMAKAFNTEFEINGKTVSLHKVEYNADAPLPLQYGEGKGLKSNITRSPQAELPPIKRVYVQGGDKNIDRSKYKASLLHLPINAQILYDGAHFEDEKGFNKDFAKTYTTDNKGYCVTSKESTYTAEESLDCSEIYPKRIGRIDEVVCVNENKHFYDFIDTSIPQDLNYEDYRIAGEKITVIFQSGMLAGKEFEIKYYHEPKENKQGRRFEIVPQEIDGITMPDEAFKPVATDTYIVYKCALPDAYINEPKTKQGAEWEMMRKAIKYLYDREKQNYTFNGKLDDIFAKKKWDEIKEKLCIGGYVLFTDKNIEKEGINIRITCIKDYINNPYSPEIQLTNTPPKGGISAVIQGLQSSEVLTQEQHKELVQFTKRRLRTLDVEQVMEILQSYTNKNLLRKNIPDAAAEVITFLKGIALNGDKGIDADGRAKLLDVMLQTLQSSNFDKTTETGFGFTKSHDGKYKLSITDLVVWGKAVFNELEKRKLSYVGGNMVFSSCGSKIMRVEELTNAYRCYFYMDDGTTATTNLWQVGDQARSQLFNIKAGRYTGVANRTYWRLVTAVGDNYIDLSKTDCEENSDAPQAEDTLVQFGNRTDHSRQALIYVSVNGDEASAIIWYDSINSYSLTNRRTAIISPKQVIFSTKLYKVMNYDGKLLPMELHVGEWQQDKAYYYYNSVSHSGRRWLCVAPEGKAVTSEPTAHSTDWLLQVDKGESPVLLTILTDRGNIIRNGQGNVTLTAVLTQEGIDITDTYPSTAFSWTRSSGNAEYDKSWNARHTAVGKTIVINAEDVWKRAVFDCIVEK